MNMNLRKYYLYTALFVAVVGMLSGCSGSKGNLAEQDEEKNESEYLSWAIRMADSDMERNPEAWMLDFNKKPRWNYTHGVVCSALERLWKYTGEEKYYDYLLTYADTMINENGDILTYKKSKYNIDMINTGKFLFAIYEET